MSSESTPLSSFANFYLKLSKPRKRILQYFRWHQSRFPQSYPKIKNIAKFAGISERAVQKFFEQLRADNNGSKNYLNIHSRKNRFGGSSTNLYILNKNLKLAMDWLSVHGKLDASKKSINRIIFSMQKQEKVHPPSPKKFTPSSVTPLIANQQTLRTPVWIHPNLRQLGLDDCAKRFASRNASEFEIADTLEACRYQEKKRKILNPSGYFLGTLKKKMKQRVRV